MNVVTRMVDGSEESSIALEGMNLDLRLGAVHALRDVTFRVAEGEIFGIIGPNGAGKTSLINVISGAYRPISGSLRYFDWESAPLPVHRLARLGIARTFQNVALFDGLTVLENVLVARHSSMRAELFACGLSLPSARREERRQREIAEDALAFLGLDGFRNADVGTLPYGLRKKVELARALAMKPRLLLLDEPLAGMNAAEKRDVVDIIRRIHAEHGCTIIMIEHDVGSVLLLSNRVMVLHHGEKLAEGVPSVIRTHPAVVSAYFGAAAVEAA